MVFLKAIEMDGKDTLIDEKEIDEFRSKIRGKVILEGEESYEKARKIWNGIIDKKPALIVRCEGVADVIYSVNFARIHQLRTSVRSGGHNVAGGALNDGGIVIDLSKMRSVHVDPINRVARVEGGVRLGDIDHETQIFGLATPTGLVTETGIAGLTLRGGFGHLTRRFGLTSDNLLSVDIVTATGELISANSEEHSDLYWAVRGGGMNLGIVVSFEYQLYPVGPEVLFIMKLFPAEKGKDALRFLRDYMKNAPEELGLIGFYGTMPDNEKVDPEVQGKNVFTFYGCYSGPKSKRNDILGDLQKFGEPLADYGGVMEFTKAQSALDEDYPDGIRYYWKSIYLNELTDEVIDLIHKRGINRPSELSTLDIWFIGGAMKYLDPQETAFNKRDANYMLGIEANWIKPSNDTMNIEWARNTWKDVNQFSDGGLYFNFAGFEEDTEQLLEDSYGDNYKRLISIKQKYDPENIF
ncbi:MAG: FAD-binding oxidoreductase [Promethearchaeota archaeon]